MKKMLILGATSDIAQASALALVNDGWEVILTGRNMDALEPIAQDLNGRTSKELKTECYQLDVDDYDSFAKLWSSFEDKPKGVLCAVGYLGDNDLARTDRDEATKIIATNFTSLVPIFSLIASDFENRGSGIIVGISSVAGDRGRASNYTYGAAKAGFTAYLSGLRNRLAKSGVHVMTVDPGFVATRMTENVELPPMITAKPEEVGRDIAKAVRKKSNVIYSKWFWRWIMLCVRIVPESIFKKMSF